MATFLPCRKALTAAVLLCASFIATMPAKAADGPVVILVNGFGDCCSQRMTNLIDELKAMGAEFPAVTRRGLDGSRYEHYVVPWNSFTAIDQGFQVNPDPMQNVRSAMGQSGAVGALGAATDPSSMASNQGLIDKVMAAVRKGNDEKFINEVSDYLGGLPADRPVIMIGHSFGGDSVMEAAKKSKRPIFFLAALDPVGAGGLRKLDLSREVPGTVKYFYNRWQVNSLFPFDYIGNGTFSNCKASVKCDQQKLNSASGGGKLGHVAFPSDSGLQKEMLDLIRAQLGKSPTATPTAAPVAAPTAAPAAPAGSSATDMLKEQVMPQTPLKGLLGR
jgi:hypothetical protein